MIYLVAITGGFHEDGLADSVDAFGGGWTRERMLDIMHDSRIGSFGTLAIVLSIGGALEPAGGHAGAARLPWYLLAAHVLCRWTTLPLGTFMDSARSRWLGRTAGAQNSAELRTLIGTLLAFGIAGWALADGKRWRRSLRSA